MRESLGLLSTRVGTTKSVENTIRRLCPSLIVSREIKDLDQCTHLIIPGNGSFGSAEPLISALKKFELARRVNDGLNVLAICLGMQILFERSLESDGIRGLGIFEGVVKPLSSLNVDTSYHIGWDHHSAACNHSFPRWQAADRWVFFNHGYGVESLNISSQVFTTCLKGEVIASVQSNNLIATQWHPECSGRTGIRFIEGFIANGSQADCPLNSF